MAQEASPVREASSTRLETRTHMLDSVTAYFKFHDQIGKRFNVNDVHSYTIRVGALADPDWIKKANEVVNAAQQEGFAKPEIILTLTSTIPDAQVLQKKLLMLGTPTVIIELPDEVQKRYEERFLARKNHGAMGEVWFDTKEGFKKLIHPIQTIRNAAKIIQNSVESPSERQIFFSKIRIGTTAAVSSAIMGTMIYLGNISPEFGASIIASQTILTALTSFNSRTLRNFNRVDLLNDFSITKDGLRAKLGSIVGIGLTLSETQHGISTVTGAGEYMLTQPQVIVNSLAQSAPSTFMSEERNKQHVESTADFWSLATFFALSVPFGIASSLGFVGPELIDAGYLHVTTLSAGSILAYGGMYLAHRYKAQKLEKLARAKWADYLRIDYAIKKLRAEQIKKEQEKRRALIEARKRQAQEEAAAKREQKEALDRQVQNLEDYIQGIRQYYKISSGKTCQSLFSGTL